MSESESNSCYASHVARLEQALSNGNVASQAVGGEFDAVGKLEYYLLRALGLSDNDLIIDVGCGSGRLACQLVSFPGIQYVGIDVAHRLIEYAKEQTRRDDWHFEVTDGTRIPCADSTADFVTFFSVFTHLRHEDIFRYFREAARCVKPGGQVVFSFLEFSIGCHWDMFAGALEAKREWPLTQFVDRDAIRAWALHSGLGVAAFFDGDKPHIPIPEEIIWENGIQMRTLGNLGQSVAVLRKGYQGDATTARHQ